jgi:DNA-binding FrmR family transcriptional regulator
LLKDKEHMAQLLRGEIQNKPSVAEEISQLKGQVDSLTHMLEALTESKEMVSQELRMQQAVSRKVQLSILCVLFT